ncbi:hypothetical protein C7974DRAFT_415162 [Boeremia exigua]|uniref:uncharacterized protein n=1 Tax=Boeremia exigua TaxID=749465 RepID=UPI001E8E7F8A|nr:uncharacterized protein C7974DRAFT_415162 [Boeremia exigua]KAH6619908.1 hypothetical protein C7974DRAFT_415162 [Boeremia exigua]
MSRATVACLSFLALATFVRADDCPDNARSLMVHTPFTPYWKFESFNTGREQCWAAADCLFEAAGETRKQQFAANALIMGLIPLTLKEIAWPERHVVYITNPLPKLVEVLVLALGLVPRRVDKHGATARQQNQEVNALARYASRKSRWHIVAIICVLAVTLVGCYAGLVINEIYSKRSALGCVAPFFIATWYVVALLPAVIHAFFASRRKARYERLAQGPGGSDERDGMEDILLQPSRMAAQKGPTDPDSNTSWKEERRVKILSAIQGAEETWPVQLAWGVYFVAGTLVFTSIMAVTVVELVVWVLLCFAVTGTSKVLAFFLCLGFERPGSI